jgi:hypothetical protein
MVRWAHRTHIQVKEKGRLTAGHDGKEICRESLHFSAHPVDANRHLIENT